jgi:hypothetical protein
VSDARAPAVAAVAAAAARVLLPACWFAVGFGVGWWECAALWRRLRRRGRGAFCEARAVSYAAVGQERDRHAFRVEVTAHNCVTQLITPTKSTMHHRSQDAIHFCRSCSVNAAAKPSSAILPSRDSGGGEMAHWYRVLASHYLHSLSGLLVSSLGLGRGAMCCTIQLRVVYWYDAVRHHGVWRL